MTDIVGNNASNIRKRWVLLFFVFLSLGIPIIYCCVLPYITGQACADFLSGQVPAKAEDLFFQRVFAATVDEDYEWLATVTSGNALLQLKELQPKLSKKYEIIWGDDLTGHYERTVLFDNGTKVYLSFRGSWPTCPDFNVTDKETFENIELLSIEEELE
jgi:hypothetical protein